MGQTILEPRYVFQQTSIRKDNKSIRVDVVRQQVCVQSDNPAELGEVFKTEGLPTIEFVGNDYLLVLQTKTDSATDLGLVLELMELNAALTKIQGVVLEEIDFSNFGFITSKEQYLGILAAMPIIESQPGGEGIDG